MRNCNKCRVDKPLSEFGLRYRSADGIHNICKKCKRERARASEKRRALNDK